MLSTFGHLTYFRVLFFATIREVLHIKSLIAISYGLYCIFIEMWWYDAMCTFRETLAQTKQMMYNVELALINSIVVRYFSLL